jgi:hypothetical protein
MASSTIYKSLSESVTNGPGTEAGEDVCCSQLCKGNTKGVIERIIVSSSGAVIGFGVNG